MRRRIFGGKNRVRRLLEEDVPEHEHDSPSAHGDVRRATKGLIAMSANETVRPTRADRSSMALRQIKPHTAAFATLRPATIRTARRQGAGTARAAPRPRREVRRPGARRRAPPVRPPSVGRNEVGLYVAKKRTWTV